MKKILFFLCLFIATIPLAAQTPMTGPWYETLSSDPSGSCSTTIHRMAVNTTNYTLWVCDGTWHQAGGSSFTSPLTTKGDLFGRSASADCRVPVGSNGKVLASDSTNSCGVSWQTVGTASLPDWLSISPNAAPTSAGTLDDEFTDANFNDNGKWTQLDASTGGNATITQTLGWVSIFHASNAGAEGIHAIVQTAPATPWTIVAKCAVTTSGANLFNSSWTAGVLLRDSGTSKLQLVKLGANQFAPSFGYTVDNYSAIGTYNSTQVSTIARGLVGTIVWFKLQDDGTNVKISASDSGATFTQIASWGRTTYLASPDQVGLFINPFNQYVQFDCDFFRRTQ